MVFVLTNAQNKVREIRHMIQNPSRRITRDELKSPVPKNSPFEITTLRPIVVFSLVGDLCTNNLLLWWMSQACHVTNSMLEWLDPSTAEHVFHQGSYPRNWDELPYLISACDESKISHPTTLFCGSVIFRLINGHQRLTFMQALWSRRSQITKNRAPGRLNATILSLQC